MNHKRAWQLALEQSRVVNRPQRNLMNAQMPGYLVEALENSEYSLFFYLFSKYGFYNSNV